MTFIAKADERIKFAVDFKTTYRQAHNPDYCNGFTLGSHGGYFANRMSTKNIQYPYREYAGHFCLGAIYSRLSSSSLRETRSYDIAELESIGSVIGDLTFFVHEKWRIASDKHGSGNTANIGSIGRIDDVLAGRGMFSEPVKSGSTTTGRTTVGSGKGSHRRNDDNTETLRLRPLPGW